MAASVAICRHLDGPLRVTQPCYIPPYILCQLLYTSRQVEKGRAFSVGNVQLVACTHWDSHGHYHNAKVPDSTLLREEKADPLWRSGCTDLQAQPYHSCWPGDRP
jgi:hypothetical protein